MNILQVIYIIVKFRFMSGLQKEFEIIALRSQLMIFQEHVINKKIPKPRVNDRFRRLWVLLSKILPDWQSSLMLFKPETVIVWYNRAFKFYWRRKCKGGRPY